MYPSKTRPDISIATGNSLIRICLKSTMVRADGVVWHPRFFLSIFIFQVDHVMSPWSPLLNGMDVYVFVFELSIPPLLFIPTFHTIQMKKLKENQWKAQFQSSSSLSVCWNLRIFTILALANDGKPASREALAFYFLGAVIMLCKHDQRPTSTEGKYISKVFLRATISIPNYYSSKQNNFFSPIRLII